MEREEYRKIIKEAIKQAYNDDPCKHCGPGNGCDDCRGCKDAKISSQIWKPVYKMKDDYKQKFGVPVEFDDDLDIVKEYEKNWQKWSNYCRKCGGNFGDDCIDCKEWDEIVKCANSYHFWKNEMMKIEQCVECGLCRSRCPYELDIPALLKKNLADYKENFM